MTPEPAYPIITEHAEVTLCGAWIAPAVEILDLFWLPYYPLPMVQFLCKEAEAWRDGFKQKYVAYDVAIMVNNDQRRREKEANAL